ncbi:MAG: polyprenyl synthetase family protein [Candidatus Thermoplasmatota archaeon]
MDLESFLTEKAKLFDQALNGNLSHHEPRIIYDAIRWIPLSGGKRLRPIITMLSCEAVGGVPEKTIPLGIALEYLHNSTLIHDDIIDNDKWRRGLPTTHIKFGLPMAIIAGDALIGETYRMLSYMAPPELKASTYKEIIRSIADAAKRFYEGEAMDIEFSRRFDVTIPEYMNMIEKKTGQLYWLAGKGGALIGKGSKEQVEKLSVYGLYFGIIFQIKDDLLNILTDQKKLGKQSIGSDIPNGKRTLMLIHALMKADESDKKEITSIVGNPEAKHEDILRIINIYKKYGSIDYAQKKIEEYRDKIKSCLDVLEPSESKDILEVLADYGVNRSY